MNTSIDLSLFTAAVHDYERTQYEIMGALKSVQDEFAQNRIYPYLADLVGLHSSLMNIRRESEDMKKALPRRIKSIDWDNMEVVYEQSELEDEEAALVEELIDWALPHIRETIEEGTTIYEFVEENMSVETVGLIPSYVEEGYLFIPEHSDGKMHVIRYAVSLFTGPDQRYRSLKTTLLKSLPADSVQSTPEHVKLELMETEDLPNPATYFFDTDLDFPFDGTIFPVAKRKLLRRLFA